MLDGDHGGWDPDVVRSDFEEEVASSILLIPISRFGDDDFVSWPHSKFGMYTVRSNMVRMSEVLQHHSCSGRVC